MDSFSNNYSWHQKFKFIIFYFSFSLIGLVLAIWYGLGWLVLFQSIQRLFFVTPRLYIPIMRIIIGREFTELEKSKIMSNGNGWFISPNSAIITLVTFLLTCFFFWKANVSLLFVIHTILNVFK